MAPAIALIVSLNDELTRDSIFMLRPVLVKLALRRASPCRRYSAPEGAPLDSVAI